MLAIDELLKYITNSSPGIKRLRLTNKGLIEAASKPQLLEDLEISRSPRSYSRQTLEVIGRSCPLLTTFKYNGSWQRFYKHRGTNEDALAIAETMHGLRQLQLFGNAVTNDGLAKILDCCPHLESLDLRDCFNLNLGGDLEIRCSKQIKRLQLPEDCPDDDSESTESFGAYEFRCFTMYI
ncbi:putative F-box/LRR-repeat protein 23 [Rosa rugosa]|uniref:putative F-box/LRR-repeat protein 23 n=1 Tax=Rosa rugosa TaxID=74645 RepID=UPI002B40CFD5|nr:putative F-box/LRR-repeat protein 23 [Rosa rugosa]